MALCRCGRYKVRHGQWPHGWTHCQKSENPVFGHNHRLRHWVPAAATESLGGAFWTRLLQALWLRILGERPRALCDSETIRGLAGLCRRILYKYTTAHVYDQ